MRAFTVLLFVKCIQYQKCTRYSIKKTQTFATNGVLKSKGVWGVPQVPITRRVIVVLIAEIRLT